MIDFISTVALVLCLCALGSVLYDVFTYEERQLKWEKAHPGSTYIRGYRKFEQANVKASRMGGEL